MKKNFYSEETFALREKTTEDIGRHLFGPEASIKTPEPLLFKGFDEAPEGQRDYEPRLRLVRSGDPA